MHPIDAVIAANAHSARPNRLALIDAPGLATEAVSRSGQVRAWCDDLRDQASLPVGVRSDDLVAALAGADEVWWRLPRAVGAVEEIGQLIAAHAAPEVQVVAGARNKQLSFAMNKALARSFESVRGSLGRQNSRALLAGIPRTVQPDWPRSALITHPVFGAAGLRVYSHGATFAALRLDLGTRLLLDNLEALPEAGRYLDLGCGSGVIAAALAHSFPASQVWASDVSWAAVAAARLTCGTKVQVVQADGIPGLGGSAITFSDNGKAQHAPAGNRLLAADTGSPSAQLDSKHHLPDSFEVICCNPPFHRGNAKDSRPTLELFRQAGRALKGTGAEFWCVYNSHLPWSAALQKTIGPTEVVAQNTRYTLTRSVKK